MCFPNYTTSFQSAPTTQLWPLQFYQYDTLMSFREDSIECIFQEIWAIIDTQIKVGCPILCENVEYHFRMSKMGQNLASSEEAINKTIVFARYNIPVIKIEEEYTLMGTNAIISATGGSLGLFLGLSCYGVVWKLLEMMQNAYNNLKSKRVKDQGTLVI